MTSISLCMIIKNEEKLLPGCLNSVKDLVDEIVVVDTGSTDRSMDIAKKYGAKVYEHPWENDFAKHRNQSLDYANGDWIFILDADEELVPSSAYLLKKGIQDNGIDSIAVQVINLFNGGKSCAVFNSVRLFRSNRGIKYEGIVHNKEVGCNATKFFPVQIIHHGYNLHKSKMKEKFERTVSLLKTQITEKPDEPLPHHYLSASYLSMAALDKKYFQSAIDESALAIQLARKQMNNDQIYLCTHYIAAASHLNIGNTKETERICKEAIQIFPDHLDSYYLLTKIYDRTGDFDSAEWSSGRYLELREKIIKTPAKFGKVIHNSFWGDWLINIIRGKAKYERGHKDEAVEIFQQTSQNAPGNAEAIRLIGEFYFAKGRFGDASHYFEKGAKLGRDKLLLYMLLECYGRLWQTDNQIKVLTEILSSFPDEIMNIRQIGRIQFERCNYRLATFCFEKVVEAGDRSQEIVEKLNRSKEILNKGGRIRNRGISISPSISACLMVKDEEESIERCLKSIQPFIDEIILVDTGSTDNTLEIARKYDAKIYHHPWEGDFSKHRNQSMSYATCDWILIIDADEELESESGKEIKKIASGTPKNALLFRGFNCTPDGEIKSTFGTPRLFRNFMGCHYRGIVHNQPHYPGPEEPTSIKIYHYGYELDREKMALKRARTIRLLEKQIKKNPNDVFPHFNLAVSRFGGADFQGAVEEGERVIQLLRLNSIKDPGYGTVYYITSISYYSMDQIDKAKSIALSGLDYDPENLDIIYALSIIHDREEDSQKTIEYASRYIELHNRLNGSNVTGNIEYKTFGKKWQVLLAMSYAYHLSNDTKSSLHLFKEACEAAPSTAFPPDERTKFLSRINRSETRVDHGMRDPGFNLCDLQ